MDFRTPHLHTATTLLTTCWFRGAKLSGILFTPMMTDFFPYSVCHPPHYLIERTNTLYIDYSKNLSTQTHAHTFSLSAEILPNEASPFLAGKKQREPSPRFFFILFGETTQCIVITTETCHSKVYGHWIHTTRNYFVQFKEIHPNFFLPFSMLASPFK